MNRIILFILLFCSLGFSQSSIAQLEGQNFLNYQLTFPRVSKAYYQYNETLKRELMQRGYKLPVDNILIRSFKAQNEMEVWVKDKGVDTYSLFKVYKVCALSGQLGPKRMEGDRQVPEGYYFISDFNPTSDFYLSMFINYPNYSDRVLGDKIKPGGDIYIHGGCLTVGCLPMTDNVIQELYILCMNAKVAGQNYIPVHIFPTRFDGSTIDYLGRSFANNEDMHRFWINLKSGYDYFQRTHKILPVMYNQEGKYIY